LSTQKIYNNTPLLWGMLHGINDWVAGYLLATFSIASNTQQGMLLLIVYAIIGFGGQLPVGMLLDGSKQFALFSKISIALLLATPLFWFFNPYLGIIVAGFSSAFVHVTGGAICLNANNNKVGPLGIFTAPGVLGLALGTAAANIAVYWLLVPVLAIMLIGYFILRVKAPVFIATNQASKPILDNHDFIMIGILLTVTFRSLIYDIMQQLGQHFQQGILVIGISAFLGKIIGGFIADKIGWKTWVYISLPLAIIFLQMGHQNIYMLGFGVACLQSSVPISLLLMAQVLPTYKGVATAMVLGVGVALAGLPMYIFNVNHISTFIFSQVGVVTTIALVLLICYMLYKKQIAKKTSYLH
jgi:MFS transporter, FSR family, fosmidomycin resistance protein